MAPETVQVTLGDLTTRQAVVAVLLEVRELRKEVVLLSNEINELKDEVAAEGAEDVLTAQTIADLNDKIADLESRLNQADADLAAAKAGEAGALENLEATLQGVREATADLRADNPPEDPTP
jgi:chromosome segregation ATPase